MSNTDEDTALDSDPPEDFKEVLRKVESLHAMKDEERRAAAFLRHLLKADGVTPRDVNGKQAAYDFDLEFKDKIIAVEVTQATSQIERAFRAHLENETNLGNGLGLKRDWRVYVETPDEPSEYTKPEAQRIGRKPLKLLEEELPALLAKLEDTCGSFDRIVVDVPAELEELGVRELWQLDPLEEEGRIVLVPESVFAISNRWSVPEVVERCIQDKHEKSIASATAGEADQAHLFIWVPVGSKHVVASAQLMGLNEHTTEIIERTTPDLHGLDAVWVVSDAVWDVWHSVLKLDVEGWKVWKMEETPLDQATF